MQQDLKFGLVVSLISRFSTTQILLTLTLGFIIIALSRYFQPSDLPVVNTYPYDFLYRKAYAAYLSNAKGLIEEGRRKYNGPFRMITTIGTRVILPPTYADWVRSCPDLDHQLVVHHDYFTGYPGFEANRTITDPRKIVINVVRNKFNQNSQCEVIHTHLLKTLQSVWGDKQDWQTVNLSENLIRFVGSMSEAVFVGSELSMDPVWQELVISHTLKLFAAVKAIRTWPAFVRPVVHWFLPEFHACREQVRQAKSMLHPILASREQMRLAAAKNGEEPPRFNDTIDWIEAEAAGRPLDAAEVQLGLAIGALHTTTELFKQALLDISEHPELVQQIRQEVIEAVRESGWTTAGLYKMQLLDSTIKETQRMQPGSLVGLEREVVRDTILPNGVKLGRGTKIGVDSSVMWDSEVYPNPQEYDPRRYLRLRQSGNSTAVLSSSSPEHYVFGLGKSICPGRFFASNEVKIAIARIILNYDLRAKVKDESRRIVGVGFMLFSVPGVPLEIEIKRRSEEV